MLNRAAILTAPGVAALAVIRVTGPALRTWCDRHLSRVPGPMRCQHAELRDESGAIIDDPVVVLSADGAFLDLSLHGGAWVVEATIALLRRCGFEIILRGSLGLEYRDELERQVFGALPGATTELGVRCLLAQRSAWPVLIQDWARFWADAEFRSVEKLRLGDTWRSIATDRALWWLLNPPTIAIVGAPNVGKSSLANRLLARERSIVADLPGTTRDWVGETADLEGLPATLIDTPGVRPTDDPIEREAISRSTDTVAASDLLIVVLDASNIGPPPAIAGGRFHESIVVANKIDRPGTSAPADAIPISAITGQGLERLVEAILRYFGVWQIQSDYNRPRLWLAEHFEAATGGG